MANNLPILKKSALIFTDLDGTFLNNDNFSFGTNLDIAREITDLGHFIIFNSSKTFAEIDNLFKEQNIQFPIICETGGGVYLPKNLELTPYTNAYNIVYEASKLSKIREDIDEICEDFREEIQFFDELSHETQVKLSNLEPAGLILASKRVFSVLFIWRSTEERLMILSKLLKKINIKIIKGARFFHICSDFDKGTSMLKLINEFKNMYPKKEFISIAIGDSSNDMAMLKLADYPCVVKSTGNKKLSFSELSNDLIISKNEAPKGWFECLENVFTKIGAS